VQRRPRRIADKRNLQDIALVQQAGRVEHGLLAGQRQPGDEQRFRGDAEGERGAGGVLADRLRQSADRGIDRRVLGRIQRPVAGGRRKAPRQGGGLSGQFRGQSRAHAGNDYR
jgi:hypothetical protein